MMINIISTQGRILIDGDYGNIVEINGEWEDHLVPTRFNVAELRSRYGAEGLPAEIDIRAIGYWRKDAQYQSPSQNTTAQQSSRVE